MPRRVQRVGDVDSGGGRILQGVNSVLVNNIPISVDNNPVSGHGPGVHGGPRTKLCQNLKVYAENILVIVEGDPDTCGHTRVAGSPNVYIG